VRLIGPNVTRPGPHACPTLHCHRVVRWRATYCFDCQAKRIRMRIIQTSRNPSVEDR